MNESVEETVANSHGPSPLEFVKQRLDESREKRVAQSIDVAATAAAVPVPSKPPAQYSNEAAERLFGQPIAKLLGARARVLASSAENAGKSRQEIADLARQQLRADYEAAVAGANAVDSAETLAADFKDWLGVLPGEYQRRVETELRKSRPNDDDQTIEKRAAQLVREHLERADLKWKLFIADDKMCELLRRAGERGDEQAAQLLRRFERLRARLQNQDAGDRAAAEKMLDTLESHRAVIRQRVTEDLQHIRQLTAGGQEEVKASNGLYLSPEAAFEPQTTPVENGDSSLALKRNALDEPLHPHVQPATEFLRAHQRDRSESSNAASQRLIDAVTEEMHAAIALHLRFAANADVDSLFPRGAGGGTRPSGSVGDLIALLESTHNEPAAPISEYCERYLNEWRRVVSKKTPDNTARFDIDIALASRYRAGDIDFIEIFMREYNLSHADAAAAVATGIDPQQSEVLRALRWAVQDSWFCESLQQNELSADQRIANVRRNISRAEKQRRNGEAQSGSDHSGNETDSPQSVHVETGDATLDEQIRVAGNRKLFAEQYFDRASLHYQAARKIPIVRLAHLPAYWRRAVPERKERPCMQGVLCVCMLEDNAFVRGTSAASVRGKRLSQRFICREFLTEDEERNFEQFGELKFPPRMCYFCELFTTTCEVLRRDCDRESSAMLIQRFGVEIGPGGVDPDACLPLEHGGRPTGIVRPLPRFDWSNYEFATTEVGSQMVPCIVVRNLDFRLGSENGMPT